MPTDYPTHLVPLAFSSIFLYRACTCSRTVPTALSLWNLPFSENFQPHLPFLQAMPLFLLSDLTHMQVTCRSDSSLFYSVPKILGLFVIHTVLIFEADPCSRIMESLQTWPTPNLPSRCSRSWWPPAPLPQPRCMCVCVCVWQGMSLRELSQLHPLVHDTLLSLISLKSLFTQLFLSFPFSIPIALISNHISSTYY